MSQVESIRFGEPPEKGGKVVWTRQSPSNTVVGTSVEPQHSQHQALEAKFASWRNLSKT